MTIAYLNTLVAVLIFRVLFIKEFILFLSLIKFFLKIEFFSAFIVFIRLTDVLISIIRPQSENKLMP